MNKTTILSKDDIKYIDTMIVYTMTRQDALDTKKEYYEHSHVKYYDKGREVDLYSKNYVHNNVEEGDLCQALSTRSWRGSESRNIVVFHDGTIKNPLTKYSVCKGTIKMNNDGSVSLSNGNWFDTGAIRWALDENARIGEDREYKNMTEDEKVKAIFEEPCKKEKKKDPWPHINVDD